MGLPVAISFLMFVAVGASLDAEAQDCPACRNDKNAVGPKRDFAKDQHILHFDLSCKVSCQNGMERDVAVKSDFHQFANVGGNPYPHNFFSIDLFISNQKKCSEVAAPICDKLGGIKSARATRVASGNWNWDYVANPFQCTGNQAQPSPFDVEKFTLSADNVPATARKTEDPNHLYMRKSSKPNETDRDRLFGTFSPTANEGADGPAKFKTTVACAPADAKSSPLGSQIDVGVCAGCYDEKIGEAVMTSANFGALRCDVEKLATAFEADFKTSRRPTMAKLDEARRFCLGQIAHEVKSFAPMNPGCPGYSFDTQVCDALEARIARGPVQSDRASESLAPAKTHN